MLRNDITTICYIFIASDVIIRAMRGDYTMVVAQLAGFCRNRCARNKFCEQNPLKFNKPA